jgi:ABC-2 type transport system permease protein
VSTAELLGAKAATPFAFAMLLTWSTLAIYVSGALLVGEPGVGESFLGARTALLFFLIGPLLALVSLMTAVVISSRVNDPRTAQQFGALVVLPITGLFVSQLVGGFVLGPAPLMLMACALVVLNALLLWVGVRVFDRERILMRWR